MKFLGKLARPAVKYISKVAARVSQVREEVERDRHNVDLVLSAILREGRLSEVRDPVAYVEFLRGCIEHTAFSIIRVKGTEGSSIPAALRFRTLLDSLQSGVPPLGFDEAREIGLVADKLSGSLDPFRREDKGWEWNADVGLVFRIASSFARKGRLLSAAVRVCRTDRCLELGTAFGMSAQFILHALRALGEKGHLTTVEGWEPMFSISSGILKERYGNMVRCHFGRTEEILASVIESMGGVDFVFHDAGHSREDYTRDFGVMIQRLAPGAVVLFDDIRWDDPRFRANPPETYRGWREVIQHPRVKQAVEIRSCFRSDSGGIETRLLSVTGAQSSKIGEDYNASRLGTNIAPFYTILGRVCEPHVIKLDFRIPEVISVSVVKLRESPGFSVNESDLFSTPHSASTVNTCDDRLMNSVSIPRIAAQLVCRTSATEAIRKRNFFIFDLRQLEVSKMHAKEKTLL